MQPSCRALASPTACDYWLGPEGFKYWTVGHHDKLYKNYGHDIVFQDGPTGVTWRWGNFDVSPQACFPL